MPSAKGSTTARNLGWSHQQRRKRLLAAHVDGAPCPCLDLDDCGPACPCRISGHGLAMYRDETRNPDGMPLEADHTLARSRGGDQADRLLLATCNRSRGAGGRTASAPSGRPPWWTRNWTGTDTL